MFLLFDSQEEMFKHAHEANASFFFSQDKVSKNKGAKTFGYSSDLNNFLHNYKLVEEKHFYELINPSQPFYEFYDLDFKIQNDITVNNWDLFNWFEYTRSEFIKYTTPNPFNNLSKPKWIILTASDKTKLSLHIINLNSIFDNNLVFKKFYSSFKTYVTTFNMNKLFDIDWSVCSRNRNMRIIDSSKLGTERPLKVWEEYHIGERISINSTFITNAINDKELTSKLVLESHFTPTFTPEKEIVSKYVTPSVLDNIQELLNILSIKRCDEYMDWLTVGMALKNGGYNIDVWKEWSKKSIKYDEKYLSQTWDNFKDNLTHKVSIGTIHYFAKQDNEELYTEYIRKNYTISIDLPFTPDLTINEKFISSNTYISNHDCIALKSNMMTGKTFNLPNIFDCYKNIVVVYHRMSLNEAIFQKWGQFGFELYYTISDYQIDLNIHPRVIIQVDSISRLYGQADLLILDEIESTHEHLCGSNLIKNRNQIYLTLMNYVTCVKKVIVCDANLKDETVDLFCKDRSVIKIENTFKSFSHKSMNVMNNYSTAIQKLFELITNNKKIVIPTNSRNIAIRLNKLILNEFPKLKILRIDKENKFTSIEEWRQYDILIYTPTITAGISFEEVHYHHIFGFFSSRSTMCESSVQMLFRVRYTIENEMFMYCEKNQDNPFKPIDDSSLNGFIDNIIKTGHRFIIQNQSQEQSGLCIDRYNKRARLNRYYKIYRLFLKKKHLTEGYHTSYLVKVLMDHGIKIKYTTSKIEADEKNIICDKLMNVSKEIRIEEAQEILNSKDIDKSEINRLRDQKSELSKDEMLSIKKYTIKETFEKKDLDLEFIHTNCKYVKQYATFKKFKNLKKDDALKLCRQLKEEQYYNQLFENYEMTKKFQNVLTDSEYSSTGDEMSDEEVNTFTTRLKQRKDKIINKKSISRSIQHSIHYDPRYHKLEHALNLFYLAGFETLGSKKKVELDYHKWKEYLIQNEEEIRVLFKLKRIDFSEDLNKNLKNSIGKYVQARLEDILGIHIKKTSTYCKFYTIETLFKM